MVSFSPSSCFLQSLLIFLKLKTLNEPCHELQGGVIFAFQYVFLTQHRNTFGAMEKIAQMMIKINQKKSEIRNYLHKKNAPKKQLRMQNWRCLRSQQNLMTSCPLLCHARDGGTECSLCSAQCSLSCSSQFASGIIYMVADCRCLTETHTQPNLPQIGLTSGIESRKQQHLKIVTDLLIFRDSPQFLLCTVLSSKHQAFITRKRGKKIIFSCQLCAKSCVWHSGLVYQIFCSEYLV